MTIVRKLDNQDMAIILDNVVEITKGDCIRTSVDTYYGWHTINFRTALGKFEQWDYGKTEDGKKIRDKQFEEIVDLK